MKPTLTNTTLLQRRPDLIAADLNGETLMFDVESGNYLVLNATAGAIWAAVETPKTCAEIVQNVGEVFDLSQDAAAKQQIHALLVQLTDSGLLAASE